MSQTYQYGDYNRGGMIAFTFSMVVTIAFFIYVAFIHSGVDLKEIQESQPQAESLKSGETPEVQGAAADENPDMDSEPIENSDEQPKAQDSESESESEESTDDSPEATDSQANEKSEAENPESGDKAKEDVSKNGEE